MKASTGFEYPPEQQVLLRKAYRVEWLTIFYLVSVIILMYMTMGSSQAMKTAWLEDLLSLVPPLVFLIASRIAHWEPTWRFPYGYHRVSSIAFLCASLALFGMGVWLLIDGMMKLLTAEHPTLGSVTIFGHTFWQGWLMLPALVWSAGPAVFLGRAKLPLARQLHDKVLQADAMMNKADWMTATAAIVGVLGTGLGWWWADASAAVLISISIFRDGFTNLRQVIWDLMDEVPKTIDRSEIDQLPSQVSAHLQQLAWISEVQVRMREEGHVYFGEAFIVVNQLEDLVEKLDQATQECKQLDWRVHDLVLSPVRSLT